jgi:hypothetical protein
MPLFEAVHPNCELLFMFDNSQNHHARPPDALCVKNLNLSDGGKNTKKLRDTVWEGRPQLMQRPDGVQKGIRTILQERGCWPTDKKLSLICQSCKDPEEEREQNLDCCATRLLSSHDDFKNGKNWLEETLDARHHSMIFCPKFHCELNFIEMIWGYLKSVLRRNCTFSFADLRVQLPLTLRQIPLTFFMKAHRHCLRYMSGYRLGPQYHGPLLDYAVKKYKGHRAIPSDAANLAELQAGFEAKKKK